MKFGLLYLPTFDAETHGDSAGLYRDIFEQVELGEALGFDTVWAAEHHFTPYGGDIPNPPTFLAALAQRTKRMRLGSAGVALPLNRALNTAEQLAMVDAMSGGRVEIGVVRAFLDFEYKALQVDMNESRERFNESIEVLLGTWANESFSYHGKHNHFDNVMLRPRPVQRRPRIVVGTVLSPESAVYAGQHGFDLMVIPYAVSLAGVRKTVDLYHAALKESGRDPSDHNVHATFHTFVDRDEATAIAAVREPIERYVQYFAEAVAGDTWSKDYVGYEGIVNKVLALKNFDVMYDRRVLIGTPARVHETMGMAIEAGITEISCVTILPGLPQAKILESLRLFADEIMPRYRD
ncbi:MAG: LLM class flavin-dependent oxidoreductase [Gammaproteobacteria bacterium]|nr:LLM class flavin-dependent oxidoreductase [Gammaproteobacteria bacterium]